MLHHTPAPNLRTTRLPGFPQHAGPETGTTPRRLDLAASSSLSPSPSKAATSKETPSPSRSLLEMKGRLKARGGDPGDIWAGSPYPGAGSGGGGGGPTPSPRHRNPLAPPSTVDGPATPRESLEDCFPRRSPPRLFPSPGASPGASPGGKKNALRQAASPQPSEAASSPPRRQAPAAPPEATAAPGAAPASASMEAPGAAAGEAVGGGAAATERQPAGLARSQESVAASVVDPSVLAFLSWRAIGRLHGLSKPFQAACEDSAVSPGNNTSVVRTRTGLAPARTPQRAKGKNGQHPQKNNSLVRSCSCGGFADCRCATARMLPRLA